MFLYYPFFRWSTKPQFSDTYLLPAHSRNVLPAEPVGLQPSKQKNACLPAPHSLFCLQHPRQPLPTHGPRTSPDSTGKRARAPAHPPHRLPQNALPSSIRHSPASTGESPSARGEKGQFCPWRQENRVARGRMGCFCPWEMVAGHKMGCWCAREAKNAGRKLP